MKYANYWSRIRWSLSEGGPQYTGICAEVSDSELFIRGSEIILGKKLSCSEHSDLGVI